MNARYKNGDLENSEVCNNHIHFCMGRRDNFGDLGRVFVLNGVMFLVLSRVTKNSRNYYISILYRGHRRGQTFLGVFGNTPFDVHAPPSPTKTRMFI